MTTDSLRLEFEQYFRTVGRYGRLDALQKALEAGIAVEPHLPRILEDAVQWGHPEVIASLMNAGRDLAPVCRNAVRLGLALLSFGQFERDVEPTAVQHAVNLLLSTSLTLPEREQHVCSTLRKRHQL